MVATQIPLGDLDYSNPEVAGYVGVLERQVIGLTVTEMKLRTVLELVTGEEWINIKHDLENNELEKIAVAAVEKRLGVSNMDARKIVRERKAALAEDPTNSVG